ncbi:imidazolonepropionase [Candidatus Spongiihabitans sp.]|uniref:imidazolonepropionase n=1 Tax=Candidatus Spongiihabitans sp. TaxID=3101308 RepID=UPI003C7AFBE0
MIIKDACLATMSEDGRYGLIADGAISIRDGRIQWVGARQTVPEDIMEDIADGADVHDCGGRLVTPGLIDCHTHIVYAGDRAAEFEKRLQGVSYQAIAKAGGGIAATVSATRAATKDDLIAQSLPRLRRLMTEGVTTIEIKSGYGLDTENEIKMLGAADGLAESAGIRVQKTFLGAHAVPPEYAGRQHDYINLVCQEMLPAAYAARLVDAVDAFAEGIAFSVEQVERVFDAAKKLGLPIKLHAEQLSHLGGAKMAAGKGALSVDHLEYLPPEEVADLAKAGTVAVLLPGAFYFLKETKLPPIHALRENQVPIAIATDCNPGSSPVTSLLLTMNMACTFFSLTPAESLRAVTLNAAKALGLQDEIGSLEVGKHADLVIWDTNNPADLAYNIGLNPCHRIMVGGKWQA